MSRNSPLLFILSFAVALPRIAAAETATDRCFAFVAEMKGPVGARAKCPGCPLVAKAPKVVPRTRAPASPFVSSFFAGDSDLAAILNGGMLSLNSYGVKADPSKKRVLTKIYAALAMIGVEPNSYIDDVKLDGDLLMKLDNAVAEMEKLVAERAAQAPFLDANVFGPEVRGNITQKWLAAYYATLFSLMNSGAKKYYVNSAACWLGAEFFALKTDLFTGPADLFDADPPAPVTKFKFQNQRFLVGEFADEIKAKGGLTADSQPAHLYMRGVSDVVGYMVHEMTHEADSMFRDSDLAAHNVRKAECGGEYLESQGQGSPFAWPGEFLDHSLPDADTVSAYAAGRARDNKYSSLEDFAESISAYVIYPEYFRDRASKSTELKRRYDWIRDNVFTGVEFENPSLKGKIGFNFVEQSFSQFSFKNPIHCFVPFDIHPLNAPKPQQQRPKDDGQSTGSSVITGIQNFFGGLFGGKN